MELQPWFAFLSTLRQTVTSGAHWPRPWVELLPHIVRAFGVERGVLALVKGSSLDDLDLVALENIDAEAGLHAISTTAVRLVLTTGTSAMWADTPEIVAAMGETESVARLGLRHIMCVPLLGMRQVPLGVLYVDSTRPSVITPETQAAFEGLATILALVAEAGRQVEEENGR